MRRIFGVSLMVAIGSIGQTALAQAPVASFPEVQNLLPRGETVLVTDQTGRISKGKVQDVSATTLLLKSGSHDVALADHDIQRIVVPSHAVRKGMLIGLASGFVAGAAWAASQPCDFTCFSSAGGVLGFGAFFGSIGLGAGALVGASIQRDHVVFEGPGTNGHRAMATSASRPTSLLRGSRLITPTCRITGGGIDGDRR